MEHAIAIVGMAGRFPGAPDLETFWQNLALGREGIARFTDEALATAGVDAAELRDPAYVKANGVLDGVELFDASFFGFTPLEAEITDPQHRLFLETAWQALEDAGHHAQAFSGRIGVFAGAGLSTYLIHHLLTRPDVLSRVSPVQLSIANNKDYVPTRVSYKLGLTGPSISVNTACSSSLVAVHLACQSLLDYHSDMVLAGGVGIQVPQDVGYRYVTGGIASPDGHCRPFDVNAQGTVSGNGVGVVVLRRLADAVADGDTIRAVILGSAVNNDGAAKVGYTAPSVTGQAEVIAEALAVAEVAPDTVQYVEAHGTGTPVGDPIEIAALTQAFRMKTDRAGFCAIGSVKSNIGHLDEAAGVAGLIKTVLAMQQGLIPPSLHFGAPNPEIAFATSPFFVNAAPRRWPTGAPRRAGVSSFGIGGTNAHVVLQEPPDRPETSVRLKADSTAPQILTISAKTQAALAQRCRDLAGHLRHHPEQALADVAWTLQQGRRAFDHRTAVVAADHGEAVHRLEAATASRDPGTRTPHVVFLFPGQGAQHPGMGDALYESEPVYRAALDRCAAVLRPEIGLDIRDAIRHADRAALAETAVAQCAVFSVEYALAQLWQSWGIEPHAMLGHSLGELVAATVAGTFTLADGLRLVALRGRLMQALPRGAMLAVPMAEPALRAMLPEGLSIAAVNAPERCAVSGPEAAIAALERRLTAAGVTTRRLETSHAFHSASMDPVLDEFGAAVARVERRPPARPWMSNVTGRAITPAEAIDPAYWAAHIRQPVRFSDAVRALLADPDAVFLEVGPGRTLTSLVRQQPIAGSARLLVNSLPSAAEAVGRLWTAGVAIDWRGVHRGEPRARVPLPTYPFERQRYWIDPPRGAAAHSSAAPLEKRQNVADWFYVPSWRRTARPLGPPDVSGDPGEWIFLRDAGGVATTLASAARDAGLPAVDVDADGPIVAEALQLPSSDLLRIVDCTMLGDGADPIAHTFDLARAVTRSARRVELIVLADQTQDVTGEEPIRPDKAAATAPLMVLGQERADVRTRCLDVSGWALRDLLDELLGGTDPDVAWRNGYRWTRTYEGARLPESSPAIRRGGAYLITGGLGGVGLILAEHLATTYGARLALTSRSAGTAAPALDAATVERVVSEAAGALPVRGIDAYPGLERTIDRLCGSYALNVAATAGMDTRPGAPFDAAELKRRLAVVQPLERMCEYLGAVLVDEGLVETDGGRAVFSAHVAQTPQPEELHREAVARYPEFAGTFDLLAHCVRAYPEALSGAVPAIGVLYPGGEAVLLEQAAARTVAHGTRDIYIRAVRDLLVEAASLRPGRRLRVLEVGVGDGILAGVAAPALAGLDVEYHATDIGRSFVSRAQALAASAGLSHMMRFGTLDISRDPAAQGFEPGSCDVVLALDVLHATPDLRETLDHVRTLLTPGGTAAIIETVNPPRWVHFIWGLADGWWAFRDPLRTRHSPLLPLDEWTTALRDRGFAHVAAWPSGDAATTGDYGLIVARAPGAAESHAERTVRRLRAAGADVLLIAADAAEPAAMAAAVVETRRTFGALDGVIHAAGETRREVVINAIEDTQQEQLDAVLRPKVAGTESLAAALADVPLDFVLLISSNASVLGGLGLSAYAAASRYLDAFAAAQRRLGDRRWISANWDGWPTEAAGGFDSRFHTSIDRFAMSLDECRAAFGRVVGSGLPQVVVSSGDLAERRRRWVEAPAAPATAATHDRPDQRTAFEAPRTATERELARVWEELLGISSVGIDDVFAELGGDSLLGTQLIARVERSHGHRLPFRALFEAPTIRQQAALIDTLAAGRDAPPDAPSRVASRAPRDGAPRLQAIPSIPEQPTYALSHAQRRLWVLAQLDGTAAYNIPLHQRLDGPLDVQALERALSTLAARHETLRTRIVTVDGEPRQCVDPPSAVTLPIVDLSARGGAEDAALALARQDAVSPFDLEGAPGWRASLVRLAADQHILLLTFHHLVCDGVSIGVLGRDLAACYAASISGVTPRLPDLPVQYRDFAAWQNAQLDSDGMSAHRAWWREALSGELPVLELPLDAARPAAQTFVGRERGWHLEPDRAAPVAALARARNASLFMVLSAAVKALLHRYTGQEDIIIGSPVAGRTHPDLEHQVGFYLNMLALRDRVQPSMRFADLLDHVRATAAAAYDHQDYPFDRLVHDLNLPRDLSRSPVFDVILILQNQQESQLELPGLRTAPVFDHNGTSKADLTFNFKESARGLAIGIEFNTDLFSDERIGRMGGHLIRLLESVASDPLQAIGAIDLLSEDERAEIGRSNDTARSYPPRKTVVDLVREAAQAAPDREACTDGATTLTYAEVERRTAAISSGLYRRGVRRGDRVGVHLERCADMVPALLAVLNVGAAYVPLDPAFPADRLRLMAEDAAVRMTITRSVLDELLAITGQSKHGRPGAGDLAYVIYTSGSTGRPKGVAIEHRALVNFLCSMQREPGLSPHDTLLAVTTLSFDIAGLELWLPLITGARVVIASREQASDGGRLQTALRESGATVMQATPATWQMLIESGWTGDPRLTVLCGGEALPRELADWLSARCHRVWNLYGPTETTIWSSTTEVTGASNGAIVPIGQPIANTSLYVLDGGLRTQPAGVAGELYIGGDGVARGYIGQPGLTADRFVPDPFSTRPGARMYRTGDRAVRRFDGSLDFLGRFDDQIKLRGFRIETGEIENALLAHPRVARAAVVLDHGPSGARLLAALVAQADGGDVQGDALIGEMRGHLRSRLPEYMVPSAFVFLEDLPRTPNGKVNRGALRALASTAAASRAQAPLTTPAERRVAGIWRDVLGLESVGADTDFFQAGGHSLTAARLAFRLGEAMGVAVTLMDIFRHPTVAALARFTEERAGDAPARRPDDTIPIAPMTADELDMLNE